MVFQEMEWALINEVDAEDFDLPNITDDENESEFGTLDFDTDEVVPFWSDENRTACIDIVLLVKYQR